MASSSSSFSILLLRALFIFSTVSLNSLLVTSKGGFSVEIIHRDSPKSPFYDPSSTPSSRLKAAAIRSRERSKYFKHVMDGDDIYSNIIPNNFEYLMSINLGSPPKQILAIADTGSDLIWIQCLPCDQCYHQTTPLFNPQSSSTYKLISCDSGTCSDLRHSSCSSNSDCEYNYSYGDGSFVDGLLSTETISFNAVGGRTVQFPTTFFGCTHLSNGTFDERGAGLVGLGGGQLSLIRQLGSAIDNKFSYCLPSADQTSAKSLLNFGSSATVSNAFTTPLISGSPDTFYFLNLEQISVNGQGNVAVKPAKKANFKADVQGNIIIDSGTTLTLIDDDALQSITSKITSIVNLPQVNDPNEELSLCFDISSVGGNAKFPDITFHFSGNAPIVLHQSNAFVKIEKNIECLALISSASSGINIFGNIAQQNFHIGYDLDAMQLSLAPTNCANL